MLQVENFNCLESILLVKISSSWWVLPTLKYSWLNVNGSRGVTTPSHSCSGWGVSWWARGARLHTLKASRLVTGPGSLNKNCFNEEMFLVSLIDILIDTYNKKTDSTFICENSFYFAGSESVSGWDVIVWVAPPGIILIYVLIYTEAAASSRCNWKHLQPCIANHDTDSAGGILILLHHIDVVQDNFSNILISLSSFSIYKHLLLSTSRHEEMEFIPRTE